MMENAVCLSSASLFTAFLYKRSWKGSCYFGVRENPFPFSLDVTILYVYIRNNKLEMGMESFVFCIHLWILKKETISPGYSFNHVLNKYLWSPYNI